jgi:hypothetical protein
VQHQGSGACDDGTTEAGREYDPLASEGEERAPEGDQQRGEKPAAAREERGITHGSPLPRAEYDRLKDDARRGGAGSGPAQRDRGDHDGGN